MCNQVTAVPGCYSDGTNAPVSVIIHTIYDGAGQPAVIISDIAGTPIAGATLANTTVGACVLPAPDFEWVRLCDKQADGSSIEFFRRSISSLDGLGNPSVSIKDYELDQVTEYTVTGTVDDCPTCKLLAARGLVTTW